MCLVLLKSPQRPAGPRSPSQRHSAGLTPRVGQLSQAQREGLVQLRKELDKQVDERARTYEDAEILDSIPGFGSLGILAVLSCIAGIGRFKRHAEER